MRFVRKVFLMMFLFIGISLVTIQTAYAYVPPLAEEYGLTQVDIVYFEENDTSLFATFLYQDNTYQLDVLAYQYYSVINESTEEVRYYIADVLENPHGELFDIARLLVYTPESDVIEYDDINVEIIVYIHELGELISVIGNIDITRFDSALNNTSNWSDLDEELENRLLTSLNIVENYLLSVSNNNAGTVSFKGPEFVIEDGGGGGGGGGSPTVPTNIKANSQNTVNLYQYDTYTKTDQYIDGYSLPNNSWKTSDDKITDDDIIKIIPKSLFFTTGIYTYVGEEYGFFVNTTKQQNYLYVVEVFVFDIEVTKPGMALPIAEGKAKVIPLFQYKYYAREKGTMSTADWNMSYTSSLTRVVYPHLSYDAPNYYLKNVAFRFTVDNYVSKNYGDSGYSVYSDSGDFILQTRYNFSGEGKKTGRNSFVLDTALFAVGFVPGWGDALSILQYSIDVYNNVSQGTYKESREGVIYDNEINITTNYQYREDQILYYGNLLKSVKILPKNQTDDFANPLLIGTRIENNYVQGIVMLTNEGGQSASQESRFYTSISLDVAYDGTYYVIFDWFPSGSVNTVDSSGSVYNYGNYKRGTQLLSDNQVVSNTITKSGESKYFKFVPSRTGTYTFETTGTANTFITVYDINGNIVASDDDSGTNFNAKVTNYLYRNNTYYIQARMKYTAHTGSFNLKVGYGVSGTLPLNTQLNVWIVNQFFVYEFTPSITKEYVIQTLGTVNTLISIYDSNGNLVASNDNWYDSNGNYNYNARCLVNLTAGQKYYVKVSHSSSTNIIPYYVTLFASPAY